MENAELEKVEYTRSDLVAELAAEYEAATALASERAAHAETKRERDEARQALREARREISKTHKSAVKHENCERQHCPICEGGLFQCADCGAAEIETEQRVCTGSESRSMTDAREIIAQALQDWFDGNGFLTYQNAADVAVSGLEAAGFHINGKDEVDQVTWQPIETAPKDGTILRLLVRPGSAEEDGWTSFEDSSEPYQTIGFNALSDTLEDVWQFAGWDWCQDCFTDGAGEVIGWLPFDTRPSEQAVSESMVEAEMVVVSVADINTWRAEWMVANDPQDGTDCVTPFDKYLYTRPIEQANFTRNRRWPNK